MIGNRNIITYICEHMHQQCDYVCGVVSCVTAAPPSSQGWMYLYFPSAICSRCILWPRSWLVGWIVRNVFYPTLRKRMPVCALDFQKKVRFSENILDFCLKIWRSGIRLTSRIPWVKESEITTRGRCKQVFILWELVAGSAEKASFSAGVGGWGL